MSDNNHHSPKILWTAPVIANYCGVSKPKFLDLVRKAGFPAVIVGDTWCAHTDNIEEWFRRGTINTKPLGHIPDDVE